MKQKAIICDIDGVLLDMGHIFERIEFAQFPTEREKWDFFNRHANEHDVVADSRVIEMLDAFAEKNFRIIFLTARMNEIESATKAKIDASIGLFADKIFPYMLLTRPTRNVESSSDVKKCGLNYCAKNTTYFARLTTTPKIAKCSQKTEF